VGREDASAGSPLDAARPSAKALRWRVIKSLKNQGFTVRRGSLVTPDPADKEAIRGLHAMAVQHRIEQSRPGLCRHEQRLMQRIADGKDLVPERISPRLVEVQPDSEDELLFRYARLHWSIPVSAGYGRRIRFLVLDEANDKLIGIFGLGDPVYSLGPRDEWIGWSSAAKKRRIRSVLDAFVLGAVPPYSYLLCGKLVALLVVSNEVREAVQRKYGGKASFISAVPHDGELALITTTSALGRSSIYNRLTLGAEAVFKSSGFTSGSGEFHFSDGIYKDLRSFALANCEATAKDQRWGSGFRSRREIVLKAMPKLNLPRRLIYHGIGREIFVIPLAKNTRSFLNGDSEELDYFARPAVDLWNWFRHRWLLPRARRDQRYNEFDRESYRLWPKR